MRTRSKNNITKPTKKLTLVATTTKPAITIPTTIHKAMRDDNWRRSMSDEYNAQIANELLNWFLLHQVKMLLVLDGFIL